MSYGSRILGTFAAGWAAAALWDWGYRGWGVALVVAVVVTNLIVRELEFRRGA